MGEKAPTIAATTYIPVPLFLMCSATNAAIKLFIIKAVNY